MKIKLLIVSLFLSSLSVAQTGEIFGKWQFQDIENRDKLDSIGLVMMDKMFSTLSYYLRSDYTFQREFLGSKDYGTWELTEDGKFIQFSSEKGENNTQEVIDYSETTLILKDPKMTAIFKRVEPTEDDEAKTAELDEVKTVSATKEQVCKLWYAKEKRNPEYSEQQQKLANRLIRGFIYRFDEDGTFYSKALSVENETTWEFGENNESIIIKGETFDVVWKINSITENELVLSKGNAKDKWYFSTEPNE